LVPNGDQTGLNAVAARVVRDLDRFRAPLTADALAQRRKTRLTAEQDALLLRWGYPHVMQAFRFHVTLTGPIPRDLLDKVETMVSAHFAGALSTPFTIDALSLMGERLDGRFEQIARVELGSAA